MPFGATAPMPVTTTRRGIGKVCSFILTLRRGNTSPLSIASAGISVKAWAERHCVDEVGGYRSNWVYRIGTMRSAVRAGPRAHIAYARLAARCQYRNQEIGRAHV